MWAQLIKAELKPGIDMDELLAIFEELHAFERADSGPIRTTLMHVQNNPTQFYVMVVFESEEHARTLERDPTRREKLRPPQARLRELLDGAAEFLDLTVIADMAH